MRCAACKGPAHPASGCQYTARTLVCGPCARRFWEWAVRHANGAGRRRGIAFYDHVTARTPQQLNSSTPR
jgi:hypothetical protein